MEDLGFCWLVGWFGWFGDGIEDDVDVDDGWWLVLDAERSGAERNGME